MNKKNIFHGDNNSNILANCIYNRIIGKEWFTYADIIKDIDIKNEEPEKISVSKYYNTLKKTMRAVLQAVREKEGADCIESSGNNRNKKFRYVGNSPNPLAEELNAKFVNNLKMYCEFCQDSAGFFPTAWIEEFFGGYVDLLNIKEKKRKGEQIIESSIDRQLANIELLPQIYKAIKNKQPLAIDYKPFNKEMQHLIFHPHYLKEYNGRWHLLGHAKGRKPQNGYNLALDRIAAPPTIICGKKYEDAPPNFYSDLYRHIVGVSHVKEMQPTLLLLRVHTHYRFKLIETKPIHNSQKVELAFGKHHDGEYGEFSLYVEINKELLSRILMMGDSIEIMEPQSARIEIKKIVEELYRIYSK